MRNNLHVFLGATVADAAARPLHWVYDQKKLLNNEINTNIDLKLKYSDKINNSESVTLESAMCKLFASELCVKVSNDAVQIFGGYGYIKDFPVEKYLRDSKLCTIGEGTSEIQKLVISRKILSK